MWLYKAAPAGLTFIEGLRSWSSSKGHATEYSSGRFIGFGGRCLYEADVDVSRSLDMRADFAAGLELVGLDAADYPHESPQDLCRDLGNVFRGHGLEWVAFRERPEPEYDEWLYLGAAPIKVRPVDQSDF